MRIFDSHDIIADLVPPVRRRRRGRKSFGKARAAPVPHPLHGRLPHLASAVDAAMHGFQEGNFARSGADLAHVGNLGNRCSYVQETVKRSRSRRASSFVAW